MIEFLANMVKLGRITIEQIEERKGTDIADQVRAILNQ